MSDQKTGLYLAHIKVACDGIVGGPVLDLHLVVNAPTGQVFGSGSIKSAGTAPGGEHPIPVVSGHIVHTGFGGDVRLVGLRGRYIIPFGPTMPGHIDCMMSAALAVDAGWNGHGTFTYGPGGHESCPHARVTSEKA